MRIVVRLLALAWLLLPGSAPAKWLEARTANFIVYSDGGEQSLRRSVRQLEDCDRLLRALTGTTAPPSASPLKVYLVDANQKLGQIEPVAPTVLGLYRARVGGTAAFAVRGDQPGLGGEEVLLHEYTHHFATRYYPAYYPAWFSEGFAEYVMTARFTADSVEIGRINPGRAATLLRGTWLPVERIFSDRLGRLTPQQAGQFYAESWLIVHYLFAVPERRDALTHYFADLHRGVAEPEAFVGAFETDHKGFEVALKRYMTGRLAYGAVARVPGADAAVTVRALSPAADDLLLPHAALMLGIADPALEARTIATIRAAAVRYPDDPYAQRVLARAEINAGDRAVGVAMIDRLLVAQPRDAELLYVRGVADFYSGRKDAGARAAYFAAARPWFARAAAADPGYYTALYRLAQTAPPDGLRDETRAQLVTAHALAPLVGDIAIDAAKALIGHGDTAAARQALIPIATNPHGGNVENARALLRTLNSPDEGTTASIG